MNMHAFKKCEVSSLKCSSGTQLAEEARSAKLPNMLLKRECADGSLQPETCLRVVDVESGVCVQGVRVVHECGHASDWCNRCDHH